LQQGRAKFFVVKLHLEPTMSLPTDLVPTTCDVYRPFGAGSPTYTGVPCRLVGDFSRSRMAGAVVDWTHYLILDLAADVRDGCTRFGGAASIVYADGDEVRLSDGSDTPRFVVVWVEAVDPGTPRAFKRAYLMRHTA
jgi:hypothetical protein